MAWKVGTVGFASILIWLNRRRRPVLAVGIFGLALYAALVAYHRVALSNLGLL